MLRNEALPTTFMIYLVPLILTPLVYSIPIDNGVVGQPTISCGVDSVSVVINTQNPFNGKVFVKGESGNSDCMGGIPDGSVIQPTPSVQPRPDQCPPCPTQAYRDFGGDRFTRSPAEEAYERYKRQAPAFERTAFLRVHMNTCNMKRQRQLSPPGVTVEFTAVISFHQYFITKVDRAYQVRCFYMEAEKTVTSEIEVSMAQTVEITQQAEMPTCIYSIRSQSPTGVPIRFVKVGDKVFHRWECTSPTPEIYGMLVHDCYVNDGQGQRVNTIDDRGCSPDKVVIGELTYENSLLVSYVEGHVFKFADRPSLDFQCVISICTKGEGGCRGISVTLLPPTCSRFKRFALNSTVHNATPLLVNSLARNALDVSAPKLTVVDIVDDKDSEGAAQIDRLLENVNSQESEKHDKWSKVTRNLKHGYAKILGKSDQFCLSLSGYSFMLVVCTFLLTLAISISGSLYVAKRHYL